MRQKYTTKVGTAILAGISLSACTTVPTDELARQLEEERARNARLETSNASLTKDLESSEATIAAKDARIAGLKEPGLLPPDASPGECYARVYVAPTYESVSKEVLAREASEQVTVEPPRYGWDEEQVLVAEASTRLEVVPAKYEWVEEQVLVKEASEELVVEPAVYDTEEEQILVRPAFSYWKKGRGPIERIDEMTGEIMCLVEEPAQYETVTKRVLVKPATTRTVSVPAEYKTVRKRVVASPPQTIEVSVPAQYETVRVNTMVEPPREIRTAVPAQYRMVSDRMLVEDGRLEWRSILCETNTTPDVVRELQRALRTAGYDPGPIDGVAGARTMQALSAYQTANGLASGKLTMESLRSLGVMGAS